jgi:hypothetical protein
VSDEARTDENPEETEGHILKHGAVEEAPENPDVHGEDREDAERDTEAHRFGGI